MESGAPNALSPGYARAEIGLLDASARARIGPEMYLMDGVAREAAQELGGWRPQNVAERVCNRALPGEVVPKMRGGLDGARATLSVEEIAKDLELEVLPDGQGAVGLSRSRYVSAQFYHFCPLQSHLVPSVVQRT